MILTPAEAQAMQDGARARDAWVMWFITTTDPDHPGKAVAWALQADPKGGTRLGELGRGHAGTVIETWD